MSISVHQNAPLTLEGRQRLVERCRNRPITHVAAEMGISTRHGLEMGKPLQAVRRDRAPGSPPTPLRHPTATDASVIARIEWMRREHKWSASRIEFELALEGTTTSRRTISRILLQLGLNRRRFIDPNGESNREPQRIIAERPGHMVHVDVKKVGAHPRRRRFGASTDATALRHALSSGRRSVGSGADMPISIPRSTVTPAPPIPNPSKTRRASLPPNSSNARNAGSPHTASHRSSGSSLTTGLATARKSSPKRCSRPGSKGSHPTRRAITGKWSATNRILAEEFLYARTWLSEQERSDGLVFWNLHYNYHRPHGAHDGQPPASAAPAIVNKVLASYN